MGRPGTSATYVSLVIWPLSGSISRTIGFKSRADTSRATRLLGYRPAVRIMAGLEQTIAWYADNLAPVNEQRKVAHA